MKHAPALLAPTSMLVLSSVSIAPPGGAERIPRRRRSSPMASECCSTTSRNLRFVRRLWRGVRGVRGGGLQQQRNSPAEPKMNLLVPATPGCDPC